MASLVNVVALTTLLVSTVTGSNTDPDPDPPQIFLWPGTAPNEKPGFPGPESRAGNDGSGCGANHSINCDHIYNVSHPSLTPFFAKNGSGAAIVIAPGGGYRDLSWGKEGLDVARMYQAMGIHAFVLKYRVPTRPPVAGLSEYWAPLQDAQRAIGMVRGMADAWGVDPTKIGFTGFSAGGHLTAHISTQWRTRTYAPVDGNDTNSCKPDFSLLMYPWKLLADQSKKDQPFNLSADFDIRSDHPVSFFSQNEDDGTAPVQGTIGYYLKLLSVGAPTSSLHVFNKGGHGFGLCQGQKAYLEVCDWPFSAKRFLQDHGIISGWPGPPMQPKIFSN